MIDADMSLPIVERYLVNYGRALMFFAGGLAGAFVLQVWDTRVTLFAFYAAVVGSAWLGIGPGCLAIVLSVVAVQYFFTPPGWGFDVLPQDVPFLVTFIACAVLSFAWSSQRRRAERDLESARASLEEVVQQRTAELVHANEALRAEMAERQAAEAELRETEAKLARSLRLSTVAELTASIAHEINQPLAAIVANAGACMRFLGRQPAALDAAREAAGCIVSDGTRAGDVIARIRSLLIKQPALPERLDVNEVIRQGLALARGTFDRQDISVDTDLAPDLPRMMADRVQLQQVFLNLIVNGVEAMAGVSDRPHRLTVRSRPVAADQIEITFTDAGIGLNPAKIDKIFDSFYTTKPDGIGMGLSISRSIVEAHGGTLSAAGATPEGAIFTITLPLHGVSY